MFCSNCNNAIEDKSKFCGNCGIEALHSHIPSQDLEISAPTVSDFQFSNLFKGRINRKHWILGLLLTLLFFIPVVFFAVFLLSNETLLFFLIPFYLLLGFIGLSLHIRRFHDLDQSGWMCLTLPIPIIGWVAGLYLIFASGSQNENRYGKRPPSDAPLLSVLLGKV